LQSFFSIDGRLMRALRAADAMGDAIFGFGEERGETRCDRETNTIRREVFRPNGATWGDWRCSTDKRKKNERRERV
jgi:hypothetical protein